MTRDTEGPLTSWTCDTCGERIETVDDGYVEWRQSTVNHQPAVGFHIVHHASASPRRLADHAQRPGEGCYQHGSMPDRNDLALRDFIGVTGIARLLAMIEDGVADMAGFLDLFRRVQVPWYEEARRKLEQARDAGLLDQYGDYAYFPDVLQTIAQMEEES